MAQLDDMLVAGCHNGTACSAVVSQKIECDTIAPTEPDLGCVLPTPTDVTVGLCDVILLVHVPGLVVDTHVHTAQQQQQQQQQQQLLRNDLTVTL
jgi:hypothetical protein